MLGEGSYSVLGEGSYIVLGEGSYIALGEGGSVIGEGSTRHSGKAAYRAGKGDTHATVPAPIHTSLLSLCTCAARPPCAWYGLAAKGRPLPPSPIDLSWPTGFC